MIRLGACLAATLLFVPAALADVYNATVTFDVPPNSAEPGLIVQAVTTAPVETPFSAFIGAFSLDDVGDSYTTDIFALFTPEAEVAAEDLSARVLILSFAIQGYDSAAMQGLTQGVIAGTHQSGEVSFLQSVFIDLDFGEALSITASSATFNTGTGGLTPGFAGRAAVSVTFELMSVSSPAPVPVPAALPLALSGLGLLWLVARRGARAVRP